MVNGRGSTHAISQLVRRAFASHASAAKDVACCDRTEGRGSWKQEGSFSPRLSEEHWMDSGRIEGHGGCFILYALFRWHRFHLGLWLVCV